jgi:hypothetical protein
VVRGRVVADTIGVVAVDNGAVATDGGCQCDHYAVAFSV